MIKSTLKDIVNASEWEQVERRLRFLYPQYSRSAEGFKAVYMRLRDLEPAEGERLAISITHAQDENDGVIEDYWDVSDQASDGVTYGIELVSWAEWLGYLVPYELRTRMSSNEILAHCLWEMTFYGYTEDDIEKFKQELSEAEAGWRYL